MTLKCPSCGADVRPGQPQCHYCGSAAYVPSDGSLAAKFDAIKQSRAFAQRDRAERHAALPTPGTIHTIFPVVFLGLFIAVGAFMAVMAMGMSGVLGLVGFSGFGARGGAFALIPLFMSIVPIGFVVLGVFLLRSALKKTKKFQQAPILGRAAVVCGKRTQVSGGSGDSSASTNYFLTFELEDGERVELGCLGGKLYGQIKEGDAGVLYSKDVLALDFDRIDERAAVRGE